MKTLAMIAIALALALQPALVHAQKSALDGMQFDGVSSDGELKVEHLTRRQWLKEYPVQAKEYWSAWDCKDKPCDCKWQMNIRSKAALIPRLASDPKPEVTMALKVPH